MVRKTLRLSFLLIAFLVASCSSDDEKPVLSTAKEMTSFSFETHLNENLPETVVADIQNGSIILNLPKYTDLSELVATFDFKGMLVRVESKRQESGVTTNDFSDELIYVVEAEDGSSQHYKIQIEFIQPAIVLPHIYFELDDPNAGPNLGGANKKIKFPATMTIDGKGVYEDFEGPIDLRGRGNSTWLMPKKPYKIYLKEKTSLFGLAPYKKWVLLNEYIDGSMLYNSVPFKTGALLGVPYTHHVIPVEITINGEYRGVYAFTEDKEVGPGRIDIGDDGWLLEMDVYYDEDWKFRSQNFNLPMMVQFPEDDNINQGVLTAIQNDFNQLESLVYASSFPDNEYLEYLDDRSFVDYMIVYMLTDNEEINHPKSTYMNKPAGEKYRMGILWDFDWAYGYEKDRTHYRLANATRPLFWDGNSVGTLFFGKIMQDPHIQQLFKERWDWFVQNKYQELREYVMDYGASVKLGLDRDHQVWGKRTSTGNADQDLENLLNWLDARVDYMNNYSADFQ